MSILRRASVAIGRRAKRLVTGVLFLFGLPVLIACDVTYVLFRSAGRYVLERDRHVLRSEVQDSVMRWKRWGRKYGLNAIRAAGQVD